MLGAPRILIAGFSIVDTDTRSLWQTGHTTMQRGLESQGSAAVSRCRWNNAFFDPCGASRYVSLSLVDIICLASLHTTREDQTR